MSDTGARQRAISEDGNWHLDKKVPIAVIAAIVAQTGAFIWWAGSINERVSSLERRAETTATQGDRLTRVEVKIESIQEGITRIERMIRRDPIP